MSTSPSAPNYARLRHFLAEFSRLVEHFHQEKPLLEKGHRLLSELVRHDDWLPEVAAIPHPQHYQQHLLYADPQGRFSVVSFVWGPGQQTPIHNHGVWGLIGMLRGSERSQFYARVNGKWVPEGEAVTLRPGDIETVSPGAQDVHQVSNAFDDRVSVSIHVYGANIGAVQRRVYTTDGDEKPFISGYSGAFLPNIWDLSKERAV
ncbi:cysteine dioxygenase [Enterobacteriaceae bacterium H20N1]|uniref:Cysteine dioxygenase n=1 Tax=Dryocola boscaweniae TaxID=2925397 RepID=A0A9X3APC7_9ENTR|nr:cysteine dioxygenase [Dryocola boscaweniae]MCT4703972.1 cysteine dioxygenase [Dryocola boscaweniae]MCT4717150.1 cysteine dioxygenase [Dryocola boscaweniae]MCT4721140.1 cysteine dioxygenase [Dryocola boscaweniae]